jgi:hypothetical protein
MLWGEKKKKKIKEMWDHSQGGSLLKLPVVIIIFTRGQSSTHDELLSFSPCTPTMQHRGYLTKMKKGGKMMVALLLLL